MKEPTMQLTFPTTTETGYQGRDVPVGALAQQSLMVWMWDTLAELKITTVVVSFSGAGDSGDIDDVNPMFEGISNHYTTNVDQERYAAGLAMFKQAGNPAADIALEELIKQVSLTLLDEPGVPDWVNNDGGDGEITLDTATRAITLDINVNIVEKDNSVFTYDAMGSETHEPEEVS